MKPYEHYTVEDFLRDEGFRDWVQGQCPREAFWIAFRQEHPEQLEAMHQAEQIIRAAGIEEGFLSEKDIRTEVDKFLAKAGAHPAQTADRPFISKQPGWRRRSKAAPYLIAATLVAAVAGLAWIFSSGAGSLPIPDTIAWGQNSGFIQTTNPTQHPMRLMLSDSTEVIVSPGSSLRYPSKFPDSARMVYLDGEASFSVTHRGQPFLVRTGDMVTRVLGTRFVVTAFRKDPKITVQVLSGKVSVYRTESGIEEKNKKVNGLILTANQAAIFEKNLHHLTKTLVADPIILAGNTQVAEQQFDEVPLPEILHQLEQRYGIPIQYDHHSLRNCRITATLPDESLYEILDMLCKTVLATYQIVDGQIVIGGKGCS
jgi:transmembrane sensor